MRNITPTIRALPTPGVIRMSVSLSVISNVQQFNETRNERSREIKIIMSSSKNKFCAPGLYFCTLSHVIDHHGGTSVVHNNIYNNNIFLSSLKAFSYNRFMKKAPSPHDRNFMKMCHKDPVNAAQLNLHIFVFCNIFHTPLLYYIIVITFKRRKYKLRKKTKKEFI